MIIETELFMLVLSNCQSKAELEGGGYVWTTIAGPTYIFCGKNYFETWTSIEMTINANKFRLMYVM